MSNNQGLIQKATQEQKSVQKSGKPSTLRDFIKQMEGEIAKALPTVITPERFTRMVLTALSTDKKLELCTPQSFLGAMMTAAQLGLEPNTPLGQAYLIPYKNKGVLECQFQIGYKGIIDLAYRSGEIEIIQAQVVYENDEFDYELGLDPKLKHKPAKENRGKPIYYYAIFKTKSGGYGFEAMSKHDIDVHAKKYSQSYSSEYSPWQKNFDEMAKKTVLKRVLKYAPLKSDFVRAIAVDETVKKEISDDMYEVPPVEIDEADYNIVSEVDVPIEGDVKEVEQ